MDKKKIVAELEKVAESCVVYSKWSKDEIDILKMFYGKVPVKILSLKLNRSIAGVNAKAGNLNLTASTY